MSNQPMPDPLEEEIVSIQAMLDQAKASNISLSEADTERIVIEPLLKALGYNVLDYIQHSRDATTHGIPDYTVLPNVPHKWFLEAKRLDIKLQDGEAAQAVRYAFDQGAQWAVLTNGRSWYVYNVRLPTSLAEKRIFQVENIFTNPSGADFLSLLSRHSMSNGGLDEAWVFQQVTKFIEKELQTPASDLRIKIRQMAQAKINQPVSDAIIGKALGALVPISRPLPTPASSTPPQPEIISAKVVAAASPNVFTLDGLKNDDSRRQPIILHFGEQRLHVKAWKFVAKLAVEKLCTEFGLPSLPFTGTTRGEMYFLNMTPYHHNGQKMRSPLEVNIGSTTVFVETHRNTPDLVSRLIALCQAIGAPLDIIRVTVA